MYAVMSGGVRGHRDYKKPVADIVHDSLPADAMAVGSGRR